MMPLLSRVLFPSPASVRHSVSQSVRPISQGHRFNDIRFVCLCHAVSLFGQPMALAVFGRPPFSFTTTLMDFSFHFGPFSTTRRWNLLKVHDRWIFFLSGARVGEIDYKSQVRFVKDCVYFLAHKSISAKTHLGKVIAVGKLMNPRALGGIKYTPRCTQLPRLLTKNSW